MNPKRMHTLFSSAAVATALSLSLASCASFDPNPAATGQGPVTPSGTQPAANPGTQPGTNPGTNPVTAMTTMTGVADIGGKAVANAPIQVFDAFTDKPVAGLVAAGAGNLVAAGAGNLVAAGAGNYDLAQAGGLKTDDKGNFAFSMPEIAADALLRVVVTTPEGLPLTTLVAGSEVAVPGKYVLKAFAKETIKRTGFNLNVNVKSTIAASSVAGAISALKALTRAEARTLGAGNLMNTVWSLEAQLALIPQFEEAKAAEALAKIAADEAQTLAFQEVSKALENSGLPSLDANKGFSSIIKEALDGVLQTAAYTNTKFDGSLLKMTADQFPSSLGIDLTKLKEGTFTFKDGDTVIEVELDVIEEVEDSDNLDDTERTPNEFDLDVEIDYNKNAGDTAPLRLKVTQPSVGSQTDVQSINASISKQWVKNFDLDVAIGTDINDPASTSVSGAWASFVANAGHKVTVTSADADSLEADWTDGAGKDIATVSIEDDGFYLNIEFTFAITGNTSVKTGGGSVTLEALKSIIELDVAKIEERNTRFPDGNDIVNIDIVSRTATGVEERANNYGNPVVLVNEP